MSPTVLLLGALLIQAREATPGVTIETGSLPTPLAVVAGMAQGADGSLLLLDPTLKSLFRFSPRGELLGRIGRDGGGPGEFRWPVGIGSLGDQIWVFDYGLRRLTLLDRTLRLDTTRVVNTSGILAPLAGGGHVVQPHRLDVLPDTDRTREETLLLLVGADGRESPIGKWTVDASTISVKRPSGFLAVTFQPFSEPPLWAVGPDGASVVLVEGSGGENLALVSVSASGEQRFRTPLPMPRVPLDDAMFKRGVDSLIASLNQAGPSTRSSGTVDEAAIRRTVNRPRDLRPITRLVVGADGRNWLQLRRTPRPGFTEWRSHSVAGAAGPAILLPSNARVLMFSSTAAWVTKENEDGEPIVVEYVLPK